MSTRVRLRAATCSKDIRVSTCGVQTFTRFYGNLVDCGLISDFRFLFNEDDFAISNLISVISARAYEISPSVGPLGLYKNLNISFKIRHDKQRHGNELYRIAGNFRKVKFSETYHS